MKSAQNTSKDIIKSLQVIHIGFTTGLLLAGGVLFLVTPVAMASQISQNDPMVFVMPILGLGGVFASNYIFTQKLRQLKELDSLSAKLSGYLTASLIRWALIEAPAIANIVWFSETGNSLYISIAGSLWLFLAWKRPTKEKIRQELELSGSIAQQFDQEVEN